MNEPFPPAGFTGTARLFPLPNLVLFPNVVQGLHIFEPRYKQLMEDALESDMLIALALLKPGWEDEYDHSPPIEEVGCLGRVTWHEKLEDGRYNLRLRGVARLRFAEELPSDRLYRMARAEALEDSAPTDLELLSAHRRALAELVLPRFDGDSPAKRQLQELFEGEMSLGQVCDILGYALPLPVEVKQALLAETRVERRVLVLADAMRASAARADRAFPPAFSAN